MRTTKKKATRRRPLKVRYNLRLTPETDQKIVVAAERLGVSRTAVIEMALREKFARDGI